MFSQADAKLLAYANQTLESCAALTEDNNNNDNRADNCAKLNAAPNVYRHPTLMTFTQGSFSAMSTRNNNFSNRQQKFHLIVISSVSVGLYIAAAVVGTITIAGLTACCIARRKPNTRFGRAINALFMGRRAFKDTYVNVGPSSHIPTPAPANRA